MSAPQYLKRIVAGMGLGLMVPLGLGLVSGSLTATDAAVRAVALYGGIIVARKLAGMAPSGREIIVGAPAEPATEPIES
jgi:hypothetical protein